MERSFVLAEMAEYLSRFNTDDGRLPDESHYYSEVAGKLRFRYKSIFGVGSPGKPLGITRQNVRTIMVQSRQKYGKNYGSVATKIMSGQKYGTLAWARL